MKAVREVKAFWRTAWLSAVVGGLVACAHVPGPPAVSSARQMPDGLAQQWQVAGRFVAGQRDNAEAETPAEPVAGRFSWQHQPTQDTVWLIGPIGNALAKIECSPTGVRWQDARGQRGVAPNLAALGESLGGVRLPDAPPERWLRGQWPAADIQARDSDGRIVRAGAQDWIFDYRYGTPAPLGWPLAIEGTGPAGLWLRIALTAWDDVTDPAERPAP